MNLKVLESSPKAMEVDHQKKMQGQGTNRDRHTSRDTYTDIEIYGMNHTRGQFIENNIKYFLLSVDLLNVI